MLHRRRIAAVAIIAFAAVVTLKTAVAASPARLTIVNNASESLLVRTVGPSSGLIPVAVGGHETAALRRGSYTLLFRWGNTPERYRYTKLGQSFTLDDGDQATLVLRSVTGNTREEPSGPEEFGTVR
jgi:hypothetical protein